MPKVGYESVALWFVTESRHTLGACKTISHHTVHVLFLYKVGKSQYFFSGAGELQCVIMPRYFLCLSVPRSSKTSMAHFGRLIASSAL